MEPDLERRHKLRALLMKCRARLRPTDVGLPEGTRRRVPGLRREEVAELAGVSAEWYSWFESGRKMRVSQQFVSRVARALILDASEEMSLHLLSHNELYQAGASLDKVSYLAMDAPLSVLQSHSAQAQVETSGHDGALTNISSLRGFLKKIGAASSFEEAATLAADTAQRALGPEIATASLNGLETGLWGYATGPRSKYWTAHNDRVVYDAHSASLANGGLGCSENLLSVDELTEQPKALNTFQRHEQLPSAYDYECAVEVWRDFNVGLRARSCIVVPLFERRAFRGFMAMGWVESRTFSESDMDTAQTIAAIVSLITTSSS